MSSENSTKATIHISSLFPEALRSILDSSILRRAQAADHVELETSNLRDFGQGRHNSVDDAPFGGGQGMLFTAPVIEDAFAAQLRAVDGDRGRLKVLCPHPRGAALTQQLCQSSAQWLKEEPGRRMWVLCGRYEGIDERALRKYVDLEFCVGDFIVTGGELPALLLVDGVTRLLPGVLGNENSAREDSFTQPLLEHPQYTRPQDFQGQEVPQELLSGHHGKIAEWKLRESLHLTAAYRPDLLRKLGSEELPHWAHKLLIELQNRIDLRA